MPRPRAKKPLSEGRLAFRLPDNLHAEAKEAAYESALTASAWIRVLVMNTLRVRRARRALQASPPPGERCSCGWVPGVDATADDVYADPGHDPAVCPACALPMEPL